MELIFGGISGRDFARKLKGDVYESHVLFVELLARYKTSLFSGDVCFTPGNATCDDL